MAGGDTSLLGLEMSVRGLPELIKNLETLEKQTARKIVRPAFMKGAQIVARAAKRNVPVRSGYLKKSIKAATSKKILLWAAVITDRGTTNPSEVRHVKETGQYRPYRPAFIAQIVERGRKAHPREVGAAGKTKKRAVAAMVARPFMIPAFEANEQRVYDIIADEIRKRFS